MSFIFLRQQSFRQACNLMPKSFPARVPERYPSTFQCWKSTRPKSKGKHKSPSQQSERNPIAKHPSKQSGNKKPTAKRTLPLGEFRQPEPRIKVTLTKSIPSKPAPIKKIDALEKEHDAYDAMAKRAGAESQNQLLQNFVTARQWDNELEVQKNIVKNRKKLLWPGLFTVASISGIYCGFAYLDEQYDLQDRNLVAAEWSNSWYFTPTIIWEGIKNGVKEVDVLTLGVMGLYTAIYLTKRLPIRFWERLAHIAGDRTWTLATYSFVHPRLSGLTASFFFLIWFMPGVVRYFDGDYLHAAAFYLSLPILLCFLRHFQFLGKNPVLGIPLEVGSSGALCGLIGAYTAAYPWEKIWVVVTGPFRFDAIYITSGFLLWEIWKTVKKSNASFAIKGSALPTMVSHIVSALTPINRCCLTILCSRMFSGLCLGLPMSTLTSRVVSGSH